MSDEQKEIWMHKIREYAPRIKNAHIRLYQAEADVKKTEAILMTQAMSKGIKTNAGQKHFAEESDQLHEARLKVGVCKGELESIKVELRALDVGFEQWRTEAVNNRTERQRYGA
jgi:hypothetical protein|tara:strand:+ start:627 stop:968 length:342 start_codon:yes stop_codon:yes gene_type:complete